MCLEREHKRCVADRRATEGWRCVGELRESVRRFVRVRGLPRERLRARGGEGRPAGILAAVVVQERSEVAGCAVAGGTALGRGNESWRSSYRSHREALYRRQ